MHQSTIVKNYTILWEEQIGTGNFASVVKCFDNIRKKVYAAKILDKVNIQMDQNLKQSFDDEITSLRVNSQHLVQFIEVVECKNHYYIIQELCDCNLRDYMRKNRFMPEKEAIRILRQIAIAVHDLFLANITHRDLKPENILLKDNKVKVADFGVSKRNPHNKCTFDVPAGSITYMSLEALKGQKYTSKCDIWSIGLIFYELLHGYCPWYRQGDNKTTLIKKISQENLKMNNSLEETTRHFLKKCLAPLEENRIDWIKFFAHPIFEDRFKEYTLAIKKCSKRMGKIYTNLANTINREKITLQEVLQNIVPHKKTLDFMDFYRLLLWGDKSADEAEARFIFQETDFDQDGLISPNEIQIQINIQSTASISGTDKEALKISNTNKDLEIKSQKMNEIARKQRIQMCFLKAQSIMNLKNESIEEAYKKWSNKSTKMSKQIFINFMKKYWIELLDSEINEIYCVLASTNDAIQYHTFHLFHEKVTNRQKDHIKLRHKQSCPQAYLSCMQQFEVPKEPHHQNFKKSKTMKEIDQQQLLTTSQSSTMITETNSKYVMRKKTVKSVHSSIIRNENDDDWAV